MPSGAKSRSRMAAAKGSPVRSYTTWLSTAKA